MVYYIITYVLGLGLMGVSKKHYFLFFIFILYVFPFSVYLLFPNVYQYSFWLSILCLLTLAITSLNNLTNQLTIWYINRIIVILFLFAISSLFFGAVNGVGPLDCVLFFKHNFWSTILFLLIVSSKTKLELNKYLHYLVVFQVGLGLAQYLFSDYIGHTFLIQEYSKDGIIKAKLSDSISILDSSLIVGSFGHVTILGNFLSLYTVYWFGNKYLFNRQWRRFDYLFLFSTVIVIMLTGVRSAFLTALIGMVTVLLIKGSYRALFYTMGLMSVLMLAVFFLRDISYQVEVSYADPFTRLLSLITIFEDTRQGTETNLYTVNRSINILEFLDFKSFILGSAIYTKNPFGYGEGISSITDAMLAFMIIEFGIIIFLIVVSPYFLAILLLKKYCDRRIYYLFLTLFITLIFQTITDQGIFDIFQSFLFFILAGSAIRNPQDDRGSLIVNKFRWK
jgi:hypothetical protein